MKRHRGKSILALGVSGLTIYLMAALCFCLFYFDSYRNLNVHLWIVPLTVQGIGPICSLILAACAWTKGRGDLEAIKEGTVDPNGRSMVQAGKTCGVIGVLLFLPFTPILLFGLRGVLGLYIASCMFSSGGSR
jgi:hypothetical protein